MRHGNGDRHHIHCTHSKREWSPSLSVKLRKPELAGVGLVSRSHQPGLVFTEPAIVSDVMRWRPDAGQTKRRD